MVSRKQLISQKPTEKREEAVDEVVAVMPEEGEDQIHQDEDDEDGYNDFDDDHIEFGDVPDAEAWDGDGFVGLVSTETEDDDDSDDEDEYDDWDEEEEEDGYEDGDEWVEIVKVKLDTKDGDKDKDKDSEDDKSGKDPKPETSGLVGSEPSEENPGTEIEEDNLPEIPGTDDDEEPTQPFPGDEDIVDVLMKQIRETDIRLANSLEDFPMYPPELRLRLIRQHLYGLPPQSEKHRLLQLMAQKYDVNLV